MANPNLVNIITITGKSTATVLTVTTNTTVLINNTASSYLYKVNTIMISNSTITNVSSYVNLMRSNGVIYSISPGLAVPSNSIMVVSGKDTTFYLEEGDQLFAYASTSGVLTTLISYEIMG